MTKFEVKTMSRNVHRGRTTEVIEEFQYKLHSHDEEQSQRMVQDGYTLPRVVTKLLIQSKVSQ